MKDDEIIGPIEREMLCRSEAPYDGVMGSLPTWVPDNFHREFHTIRDRLLKKYTHEHLLHSIATGIAEAQNIKGMLTEESLDLTKGPFEFSEVRGVREASFLARLKKAVDLGPESGLALLTDPDHASQTVQGKKFLDGRKIGSIGAIRKFIRTTLKKDSSLKNEELWEAIRKRPPKGWTAMENSAFGRYVEGPSPRDNVKWSSFCNIAAKERRE